MNGVRIKEGGTEFMVPEEHSVKGPGKIRGSVFFNSQMAFNRDVNIMLLKALGRKNMSVADAMSATGARAVRIANEVPDTFVTANDINADAVEYIKQNIELNSLENCVPSNRPLGSLLAEESFDYVDLDPFGSPVPFLHAAISGCRRKGILAVTATDAAPLSGAHRAKCERRYSARPLRGPMCHEAGLRILMGHICRELARLDRGMVPLLSFSADHYFRTYILVENGAAAADRSLSQMGYISYDQTTMERGFASEPDKDHKYGPLWGGKLFDRELLSRMSPEGMSDPRRCASMLEMWRQEIDSVPLVYSVDEISSFTKRPTPKFEDLIESLRRRGDASRTHLGPVLFKTSLPLEEIVSAYDEAYSAGH
ncbi:N2,N2-dimethylguanosine tRNA methyltransferase [Methanomassiliicoccales archaeon RumEn M2]|nr:N2,N2-dimethylguanosine tRNA methyltransferase [Methanomassiliicoccales archaeon RumEn M2]